MAPTPPPEVYTCLFCSKTFAKPANIARHYQSTGHGGWVDGELPPKRRQAYSYRRKRDIIQQVDALSGKMISRYGSISSTSGIEKTIIRKWATVQREKILYQAARPVFGNHKRFRIRSAWFPAVEALLYASFLWERLNFGRRVSRNWLAEKYRWCMIQQGEDPDALAYSKGLISAFCSRWSISEQSRSNSKLLSLEDRLPRVREFHRWLIYDLQRSGVQRCPKYGRFPPSHMFHMDQIPLQFSRDTGRTMNPVGSHCKWLPSVGDDKRFCSLQLCIRAGGEQVVRPWLLFRGQGCNVTEEEEAYYRSLPHVRCEFQENAWADQRVSLQWLEEFRESTVDLGEVMLGLDRHAPQQTMGCRTFMEIFDIKPVFTPADCTDVVSPCDKNVGNHFQRRMGEKYHAYMKANSGGDPSNPLQIGVPKKRMLMAGWMSEVWEDLISGLDSTTVKSIVTPAFVKTGFLLAKDGSENSLVSMDGWIGEPGSYDF